MHIRHEENSEQADLGENQMTFDQFEQTFNKESHHDQSTDDPRIMVPERPTHPA